MPLNELNKEPYDLIVFDTLAALWPVRDENDASEVQSALTPLHILSERSALLLVHHLRKGDGSQATGSRGSGALPSFVDVICELRRQDEDVKSPRRILTGYGRWDETPGELVIELDKANGTFVALGDRQETAKAQVKRVLREMLPKERPGMTYELIKEHWPDEKFPRKDTVLEALKEGASDSLWIRDGAGRKGSPHTFWVQV